MKTIGLIGFGLIGRYIKERLGEQLRAVRASRHLHPL